MLSAEDAITYGRGVPTKNNQYTYDSESKAVARRREGNCLSRVVRGVFGGIQWRVQDWG